MKIDDNTPNALANKDSLLKAEYTNGQTVIYRGHDYEICVHNVNGTRVNLIPKGGGERIWVSINSIRPKP